MLLPGNRSSFLLGFDNSRSSSVWSSDSMMIVASFKQVLSLTCATRVVLSKTTLFFDLWHGKHSVSHVPCCSFWNCLLSLLFFCFFITFFFIFIILIFCQGSGWVPDGFRAVPGGSGRFRVGSAFYIHPFSRVTLLLICNFELENDLDTSCNFSLVFVLKYYYSCCYCYCYFGYRRPATLAD